MLLIICDDISVKSKRNRNLNIMAVSYDHSLCKGVTYRQSVNSAFIVTRTSNIAATVSCVVKLQRFAGRTKENHEREALL